MIFDVNFSCDDLHIATAAGDQRVLVLDFPTMQPK